MQLGYLSVNPFAVLRQDKIADEPVRYVSPAELRLLIETSRTRGGKKLWWEAFITLC